MRVLFWSELFWPYLGGIETQAATLLPALRERGYEIEVITSHRNLDLPDEEIWQGIPLRRLSLWSALERGDMEALVRAVREAKVAVERFAPDVLHLYGVGPSAACCLRVARESPQLLVSLHQELLASQKAGGSLVRELLRRSDWIHAVSPFVARQASELEPAIGDRVTVIHNSLPPPALVPAPLPSDPIRLLCLGRVIEQKGFDVALAAFAKLAERFPDAVLTVAGDGDQRERLRDEARALGLGARVDLPGWVSPTEVPALINRSTVVVMPSRREGFGVVAAEAALMARPVVATAVGGLTDVVEHGRTGLLVQSESPDALAAALATLLADLDGASRMGRAARERALHLFDERSRIDRHDELYRRLERARCPQETSPSP